MINKEEINNILVTRTDNLGDMILTLPLISETRKVFPEAGIFFMVKKYTSEILKGYPGIDGLIIADDLGSISEKIKCFKSKKIDLAMNVKPEFSLALAFLLSGVKYRIGTAYRWYSFLYNLKVHEHRKHSTKHESEYNLNLLRTFFNELQNSRSFYFNYTEEEKNKLNGKLYGLIDRDFVIIHPGSRNSAKDLPLDIMSEFSAKLMNELPEMDVAITGTGNDKISNDFIYGKLKEKHPERVFNLTDMLDLRELMILIDHSKLFVSNSTGPIHIAGALKKSIVGFYPNTVTMSNVRWGPLSDNAIILRPTTGADDMSEISSDEILNAAVKLIKKN
ncbi:MAG: ADP-heptose--LPS heptosyltransferase 2 [Ignavibacteria bacterium]|nr:ADP-heptose--LPS heptosyltransferase 2 [Ignavibacteria bacterium]